MDKDTIYAHLGYTLIEFCQFLDCLKSFWKLNGILFKIKINNVPLISFYYNFSMLFSRS